MRVDWTSRAKSDITGIVEYIAADNPDAADNLADTIINRAEALGFMPLIGRAGRVAGTREIVAHPNYIIVYRVGDEAVHVLRVLHGRRQYP